MQIDEIKAIKTAVQFQAFMEEVWNCECEACDDGGVILRGSPLFDKWHDAVVTARKVTNQKGRGSSFNGEKNMGLLFDFPDGVVVIHRSGDMLYLKRERTRK